MNPKAKTLNKNSDKNWPDCMGNLYWPEIPCAGTVVGAIDPIEVDDSPWVYLCSFHRLKMFENDLITPIDWGDARMRLVKEMRMLTPQLTLQDREKLCAAMLPEAWEKLELGSNDYESLPCPPLHFRLGISETPAQGSGLIMRIPKDRIEIGMVHAVVYAMWFDLPTKPEMAICPAWCGGTYAKYPGTIEPVKSVRKEPWYLPRLVHVYFGRIVAICDMGTPLGAGESICACGVRVLRVDDHDQLG